MAPRCLTHFQPLPLIHLGRYHHQVVFDKTKGRIIVLGGRNEDHTLCLYVEEGLEINEHTKQSIKLKPPIRSLKIADKGIW